MALTLVLPSRITTPVMLPKKRPASALAPLPNDDPEENRPSEAKRPRRKNAVPAIPVPRMLGLFGLVQWVQSLVNNSHYGRNLHALIDPQKQFEVTCPGGDVLMTNYGEVPTEYPPFKGVCNDLSYMVGRFMDQRIGKDYVIQPVRGQCDDYFSSGTHIFLLMWPRSADAALQGKLAKSNGRIPEECFLIDPSFRRVLWPTQQAKERGRYRFQQTLSMDAINPTAANKDVYVAEAQLPLWYPLGYVQDLMPHLIFGQGLLFFGFQKGGFAGEVPQLDFMIMPGTDDRYQQAAAWLVDELPPQHVLGRFRDKVREDLAEAQIKQLLPFLWEDTDEGVAVGDMARKDELADWLPDVDGLEPVAKTDAPMSLDAPASPVPMTTPPDAMLPGTMPPLNFLWRDESDGLLDFGATRAASPLLNPFAMVLEESPDASWQASPPSETGVQEPAADPFGKQADDSQGIGGILDKLLGIHHTSP